MRASIVICKQTAPKLRTPACSAAFDRGEGPILFRVTERRTHLNIVRNVQILEEMANMKPHQASTQSSSANTLPSSTMNNNSGLCCGASQSSEEKISIPSCSPLASARSEEAFHHNDEPVSPYSQSNYTSLEHWYVETRSSTPALAQYSNMHCETNRSETPSLQMGSRVSSDHHLDYLPFAKDNDGSASPPSTMLLSSVPVTSMAPSKTLATDLPRGSVLSSDSASKTPELYSATCPSDAERMLTDNILGKAGHPSSPQIRHEVGLVMPAKSGGIKHDNGGASKRGDTKNRYTAEENLFILRAHEMPDRIPWHIIAQAAKTSYMASSDSRNGRNMQVHYSQSVHRCQNKLSRLSVRMRESLDNLIREKLNNFYAGVSDEFRRTETPRCNTEEMVRSYMRTRMALSRYTLSMTLAVARRLKNEKLGSKSKPNNKSKPKTL